MSNRERLMQLEEEGRHVFHGSPDGDIQALEPRQSTHIPDLTRPEVRIEDGGPAVSATPYAEPAIFRALINNKNVPFGTSGFGIAEDGKPEFRVESQEMLDEVMDKKGYVYVFDKEVFQPYDRNGNAREESMEWRAHESVIPVEVVEVTHEDLPKVESIKISETW